MFTKEDLVTKLWNKCLTENPNDPITRFEAEGGILLTLKTDEKVLTVEQSLIINSIFPPKFEQQLNDYQQEVNCKKNAHQ